VWERVSLLVSFLLHVRNYTAGLSLLFVIETWEQRQPQSGFLTDLRKNEVACTCHVYAALLYPSFKGSFLSEAGCTFVTNEYVGFPTSASLLLSRLIYCFVFFGLWLLWLRRWVPNKKKIWVKNKRGRRKKDLKRTDSGRSDRCSPEIDGTVGAMLTQHKSYTRWASFTLWQTKIKISTHRQQKFRHKGECDDRLRTHTSLVSQSRSSRSPVRQCGNLRFCPSKWSSAVLFRFHLYFFAIENIESSYKS